MSTQLKPSQAKPSNQLADTRMGATRLVRFGPSEGLAKRLGCVIVSSYRLAFNPEPVCSYDKTNPTQTLSRVQVSGLSLVVVVVVVDVVVVA